uniref:Phytosulfokine n=1 Tax=Rhizophora mucronata TaxID=61149 RepID=A0A2P2L375_RHIMU
MPPSPCTSRTVLISNALGIFSCLPLSLFDTDYMVTKAMKMKGTSLAFLIVLLSVSLVFSSTSARLLLPKQGQKETKANGIAEAVSETKEDFSDLMGSTVCDDKDEACLKERMMAEAHLDYIYTQHHKP